MKQVGENSDSDLARNEFSSDIAYALRELTANLIRIARGAGKPYDIVRQIDELTKALISYREVAECWPSSAELGTLFTKGQGNRQDLRTFGSRG